MKGMPPRGSTKAAPDRNHHKKKDNTMKSQKTSESPTIGRSTASVLAVSVLALLARRGILLCLTVASAILAGTGAQAQIVVGWGSNNAGGQINVPTTGAYTAIAAGFFHSLALKSDGTIVGWGLNHSGRSNVPTTGA